MAHVKIDPAILYWGTPVVLITTTNEDGTSNIAPMSSAFWLGNRCILGLAWNSRTTINLHRTGECVLNLASDEMAPAINALAKTTGTEFVPEFKLSKGYSYIKDEFAVAHLTPLPSEKVQAPRIKECPVHMEARLVKYTATLGGFIHVIEVRVLQTYIGEELRMPGYENRVDPDRWRPMFMSFQRL
ncbi:hypothetical protein BAUCODRAFT_34586 [Baudoinia panamericana UAMH 10762]|uniref:Flavin reductase like domain-containing protein n=1 Tax=Baudoinia panamericana (strain UAMH 10762) TaxID=717646 RepID=M2LN89_BAUPA|nr:uncharacterized protein BAUCODRAFT_34586 [Baudoinia panamericana UAMH 10762]EMC95817.1 hypothetical protein BAUCODRAFT_34586 [Baudoinia panamericana UAMH 10762]